MGSHPCELLFLNDLSNELFLGIHQFPLVTSDGVKKFLCCLATVTVNHRHHCSASLNFKDSSQDSCSSLQNCLLNTY